MWAIVADTLAADARLFSAWLPLRWSYRKMKDVPVWNQSFTVNVKRCDEDQQKLFCLIRRLHDAIGTEQGTAIARDVLDELREYTTKHFSA